MASNEELKIAVIATARTEALTRARKELNKLGGVAAVKAQKELNKLNRSIKQLNPTAKKGSIFFSRFTRGIALGNIAAIAAAAAFRALGRAMKGVSDAVVLAGEIEEASIVYNFLGQKIGFSTDQLEGFRQQLLRNGITQQKSTEALLRGIQAEIKLDDIVKLSLVARDAAVIGRTNTSEALGTITDSLAKLLPRELKSLGIIINLNNTYKKYAAKLNKTAVSLTQLEKKQAFLNEILQKGKRIAGAYEVAMGSATKQLRSLERHSQTARIEMGRNFTPVIMLAVKAQELLFKVIAKIGVLLSKSKTFSSKGIDSMIKKMDVWIGKSVAIAQVIFGASKLIVNDFAVIKDSIVIGVDAFALLGVTVQEIMVAIVKSIGAVFKPLADLSNAFIKLAQKDFNGLLIATAQFVISSTTATNNISNAFTTANQKIGSSLVDLQLDFANLAIDIIDMKDGIDIFSEGWNNFGNVAPVAVAKTETALERMNRKMAELGNLMPTVITKFPEGLGKIPPVVQRNNQLMNQFKNNTVQSFISMANAAQSFFDQLKQGTFTFGGLLSLFSTGVAIYSGLGTLGIIGKGATPALAGAGAGAAGVSGGGINIQGSLIVNTQASSAMAVAKEIENLSSRNLTNINTESVRITR